MYERVRLHSCPDIIISVVFLFKGLMIFSVYSLFFCMVKIKRKHLDMHRASFTHHAVTFL